MHKPSAMLDLRCIDPEGKQHMIYSFLQLGIVLLRICILVQVLELRTLGASNDQLGLHNPCVLKGCFTVSVQPEIPTSSKIHRQPRSETESTGDSCCPGWAKQVCSIWAFHVLTRYLSNLANNIVNWWMKSLFHWPPLVCLLNNIHPLFLDRLVQQ